MNCKSDLLHRSWNQKVLWSIFHKYLSPIRVDSGLVCFLWESCFRHLWQIEISIRRLGLLRQSWSFVSSYFNPVRCDVGAGRDLSRSMSECCRSTLPLWMFLLEIKLSEGFWTFVPRQGNDNIFFISCRKVLQKVTTDNNFESDQTLWRAD